MIDYATILSLNYPNTSWSLNGDSYDGLNWLDSSPKPTQAELDALWQPTQNNIAKRNCKAEAKALLAQTDWAVLPDVGLANSAEYVTYRTTLRNLVINPVADAIMPTEPEPVWS